jgi:hypothetical protein
MSVDRQTADDAEEPGLDAIVRAQALERAQRAEVRLLDEILGREAVAGELHGEAVEGLQMGQGQLFEALSRLDVHLRSCDLVSGLMAH